MVKKDNKIFWITGVIAVILIGAYFFLGGMSSTLTSNSDCQKDLDCVTKLSSCSATCVQKVCKDNTVIIPNKICSSSVWEDFPTCKYDNALCSSGGGGSVSTCTASWSCINWTSCLNNQQTRTCSDLNGCGNNYTLPITAQACNLTCSPNWDERDWSACSNSIQTRTVTDSNNCNITNGKPIVSQACTSTCTPNWIMGSWSDCISGTKTREVNDSNECGITLGKPSTSEDCNSSQADIYTCTPNWISGSWGNCIGGTKTRIVNDSNNCNDNTVKPETSQACTISCIPLWTCTDWSACLGNIKSRSCSDSNSCGTNEGKPEETLSCTSDTNQNTSNCDFITNAKRMGTNWGLLDYVYGNPWAAFDADGDGTKEVYGNFMEQSCPDTSSVMVELPFKAKGGFVIKRHIYSGQLRICSGTKAIAPTSNLYNIDYSQYCQSGVCYPDWSIGTWSTCINGTRTRTLTDLNACGATTNKPIESEACNFRIMTTTSCGGVECNGDISNCDVCLSDCHVCYPNRIKASDYGTYRLYLTSSLESGIGLEELKNISEIMRRRIYIASEGVLDNFEFYYDALNPDFSKPNVNVYDMTSVYYFMAGSEKQPQVYPYPFFSIAWWPNPEGSGIPQGITSPVAAYSLTNDGIYDYHATLHEFGHSVSCDDDSGDIMRCATVDGVYRCDYNKYPPSGIAGIEQRIKNGVIKLK